MIYVIWGAAIALTFYFRRWAGSELEYKTLVDNPILDIELEEVPN